MQKHDKMISCLGCGFGREIEDARSIIIKSDDLDIKDTCGQCKFCLENPILKECYRRGYNDGIDAMTDVLRTVVGNSREMHKYKDYGSS